LSSQVEAAPALHHFPIAPPCDVCRAGLRVFCLGAGNWAPWGGFGPPKHR